MFKKPSGKQYRILAVVWMLVAASIAVTAIRTLPQVSLLHLLLLAVSLFIAAGSWKAWKNIDKNTKDRSINQDMEDKSNE